MTYHHRIKKTNQRRTQLGKHHWQSNLQIAFIIW
jgi:hypothetical protein